MSISQTVEDAIYDVVDEFTKAAKSFSLYDVTVAVRFKVGLSEDFLHNDAKPIIEAAVLSHVNSGSYESTYPVVKGYKTGYRLFVPVPSLALSNAVNNPPSPPPFLSAFQIQPLPTVRVQRFEVEVTPTLDGRIVIPREAVRAAKLDKQEVLFVNESNSHGWVDRIVRNGSNSLTNPVYARVDNKGNIRYKPTHTHTRYSVAVFQDHEITVEEA